MFTVLYNYVPNRFTFQLDGSQWVPPGHGGGYNPWAYFTPHDVQVFAEIHSQANQMPGGTLDTSGHWDAHIYYNSAWQDGWLTTTTSNPTYWGVDPASGNLAYNTGKQFYTWDKGCST